MAEVSRFSQAEKEWLTEHQNLVVGVVEMTPPILYFEASQSKGLVADYLRLLADKLGLQLQIHQFPDLERLLDSLREGEVDVIGALVPTDMLSTDLHFSRPYLNLPAALFSTGRIADKGIKGLDGMEVSVVAGSIWEEGIPHLLPTLNVMAFKDLEKAVNAVISDKAQAYLGDTASVEHLLANSDQFDELKEMMRLDITVDVALATLYSEPVLQSLLQKGLDRLNTDDVLDIWYNWQGVEPPVKQGSDLVTHLLWGLLLALWSFILAWGVRLHSQKALSHHRSKTKRSIKRLRHRESLLKQKLLILKHKTKRYRQRVKALNQQVDFMDEVLPSCSWSWDLSKDVCRWDDEMYLMAGQEQGVFSPRLKSILNQIHEQDREKITRLFDSDNRVEVRMSYRFLLADGGERRVLEYSHYVPAEKDGAGKRVGICWDVDEFFRQNGDLLRLPEPEDSSEKTQLQIDEAEYNEE
jgi:ABC-type amino acid transport substrate-binding protein